MRPRSRALVRSGSRRRAARADLDARARASPRCDQRPAASALRTRRPVARRARPCRPDAGRSAPRPIAPTRAGTARPVASGTAPANAATPAPARARARRRTGVFGRKRESTSATISGARAPSQRCWNAASSRSSRSSGLSNVEARPEARRGSSPPSDEHERRAMPSHSVPGNTKHLDRDQRRAQRDRDDVRHVGQAGQVLPDQRAARSTRSRGCPAGRSPGSLELEVRQHEPGQEQQRRQSASSHATHVLDVAALERGRDRAPAIAELLEHDFDSRVGECRRRQPQLDRLRRRQVQELAARQRSSRRARSGVPASRSESHSSPVDRGAARRRSRPGALRRRGRPSPRQRRRTAALLGHRRELRAQERDDLLAHAVGSSSSMPCGPTVTGIRRADRAGERHVDALAAQRDAARRPRRRGRGPSERSSGRPPRPRRAASAIVPQHVERSRRACRARSRASRRPTRAERIARSGAPSAPTSISSSTRTSVTARPRSTRRARPAPASRRRAPGRRARGREDARWFPLPDPREPSC